jgi:hypothetical protein
MLIRKAIVPVLAAPAPNSTNHFVQSDRWVQQLEIAVDLALWLLSD